MSQYAKVVDERDETKGMNNFCSTVDTLLAGRVKGQPPPPLPNTHTHTHTHTHTQHFSAHFHTSLLGPKSFPLGSCFCRGLPTSLQQLVIQLLMWLISHYRAHLQEAHLVISPFGERFLLILHIYHHSVTVCPTVLLSRTKELEDYSDGFCSQRDASVQSTAPGSR